jgi:CubicO group peptidase (beta-lactamase class C family)
MGMKESFWTTLTLIFSATIFSGSHEVLAASNKVTIYEGRNYELPDNLRTQPNDATISYYYKKNDTLRYRTAEQYLIQPSTQPYEFSRALEHNSRVENELASRAIFSYLFYENGVVVYDALPPADRYEMVIDDESYFSSHSMGKSITSYLIGHAICDGYIESIDTPIHDWDLMKDTLYYGQPLINLLNMKAGDTNVIRKFSGKYTKTGRNIHGDAPLLRATQNPDELKNTKPDKNPKWAYSNLTADVLTSYLMHRVGGDYDQFITNFYQNKVRIEYPVYLEMNPLVSNTWKPSTEDRIQQGAGRYGIFATRYDYLRIAKAMMDDWQNDTCEGRYLKEIYDRRISTGRRVGTWNKNDRSWGDPDFGIVSRKYGGQFWFNPVGLEERHIFIMLGANGQSIVMDMDNSRIVVISAPTEKHYNTKKLSFDPIKYGRVKGKNILVKTDVKPIKGFKERRVFDPTKIPSVTQVEVKINMEPLEGPKNGCSDPMFAEMMGEKCK